MTRARQLFIGALALLLFTAEAVAQPVITEISKDTATLSGRVAITGSGFGSGGAGSAVNIGGLPALTSTWSDTRVVAYVPEAAALGPSSLEVVAAGVPSFDVPLTVTARQQVGRIRWSFEADGSNLWWRPALAPDGTIYIHSNDATDGIVYALSPDGALKWIQKVNWYPYVPPSAGPDGAVYVSSISNLYRISPNGAIDWMFRPPNGSPGARVAPGIGPDGLLYGAFDVGLGAYAIDPATGDLVWSNPGNPNISDKSGESVEVRFGPSGPGQPVDQFYVSVDGGAGFYAFSLDGKQRFTSSFGNLKGTAEVAVDFDGTLYGPRAIGLVVAAVDPSDGSTIWEYYPGPSEWATGTDNVELGSDGILYFTGSTAKLEAFDPGIQSRIWQTFTPGITLGRPTVTPDGSTLIVNGTDTNFFGNPGFVKGFNSRNGKELWSVDLPFQLGPGFRTYGTHHARVTPDNSTAYVSTMTLAEYPLNQDPYTFLFALDLTDGAPPPPPPPPNQPPVAVAAATPSSGEAPLFVTFDGSGSTDSDGAIVTYAWNFGDSGTTYFAPVINHQYANPGTYVATLTVTDDDGATDSATVTIDVTGPPPVADVEPPTVSFVQPADGAEVSGRVAIEIAAADNVGVTAIRFYVDNVLTCESASSPLTCTWNTKKVASGLHSLLARASDAAGNAAEQAIGVTLGGGGGVGGGVGGGGGCHPKKGC